jgi:hypothetical protein
MRTPLGAVIGRMKVKPEYPDDDVVDNDLILVWGEEKRGAVKLQESKADQYRTKSNLRSRPQGHRENGAGILRRARKGISPADWLGRTLSL